jgi:hypothetical protein
MSGYGWVLEDTRQSVESTLSEQVRSLSSEIRELETDMGIPPFAKTAKGGHPNVWWVNLIG